MLERQRIELQRASVKRGASKIKSLYDAAQDALESKLRRTIGSGRGGTFTAHTQRLLLAQVRQGQQVLANQLVGKIGDLTKQAQVTSLKDLSASLTKMEKEFNGVDVTLPLDEASTFWGIVNGRQSSIMTQMRPTVARLGSRIVGEVERGLAVSLVSGETTDEAIDRTREITGEQWYQAERIVRTEQAYAFNAAHADGIAEVAEDVLDLYMRWVEHVTDAGVPMDNRVGDDSIAMHGQVTRPGGDFTMPDDPDVAESLVGQSWKFPPNRPNDRAVVVAWRPSWGGMAWVYDGGGKRYLSR